MKETSKCHNMRMQNGDYLHYLQGTGIDIGAGEDCLPGARRWDIEDGDAQEMRGVPSESFDYVYSSHCLEHLPDVRLSLQNWCRLIRPGGYLYLVVPDFDLYEFGHWPSHNDLHLHSFSLRVIKDADRPNHYYLEDVRRILKDNRVYLFESRLESNGYDFSRPNVDQTREGALAQICFIGVKGR